MNQKEKLLRELEETEKEYYDQASRVARLFEQYDLADDKERLSIGLALDISVKRFRQAGVKKRMLEEKIGRPVEQERP